LKGVSQQTGQFMHRTRFAFIALVVLLALGFGASVARAQKWPAKPLTFVIGVPPGGAIDAYARTVGEHMARTLGQPVIVENKPGAGGNIVTESIARAPADGYTVWVGTQAMTEIYSISYDNLRWKMDDFVAVMKGVEAPLVLVVHASVPAHADPGVKEKLEQLGFDVSGETDPPFSAGIRASTERWARVVKATGFKASD
jgi:tripartite-type tricarboxylate transporter receptor subunit TctC